MEIDQVADAFKVSVVIVAVIVFGIAAIVYAIIKKKKNYDSTGIPKRVEKKDEHEGRTGGESAEWEPGGPVEVVESDDPAAHSANDQNPNGPGTPGDPGTFGDSGTPDGPGGSMYAE